VGFVYMMFCLYMETELKRTYYVESRLDFAGVVQQSITRHKRLDTDTDKVITENFTYDTQSRLLTHTHQVDNNPVEYLAQNTYNELSQLSGKKVGGTALGSGLQTVDYKYNIRGWMTQINDPANLGGKLFGYEIKYQNPIDGASTAKFNGNISEIDWKTNQDGIVRRYSYYYDSLNRLNFAQYVKPYSTVTQTDSYNEWATYDLNGNIKTMGRYGQQDSDQAILIDYLQYTYSGNKLLSVTDSSQNSFGYPLGGNTMSYDANGNMTNHLDKRINSITYNYLNLPSAVAGGGGRSSFGISYLYRADGSKLRKLSTNTSSNTTTDYLDGFQYTTLTDLCFGCPGPAAELQFVPTSEGYFDFENNKYIYNYVDHLGNVRVSYNKNAADTGLEIIEENNYYPFGLKHEGYNALAGNPGYQYKYNGKELQTETGMYDYGARFYMPDIGRWGVVDPLAELQSRFSPYHYSYNNPIFYNDPTGMIGDCPTCPKEIDPNKPGGANNPHLIQEVVITGTKKPSFNYSSAFQLMLPSLSLTGALPAANSSSLLSYFSSFTLPSNAVVLETATAAEAALLADDVTGVGVADDILIPVIFAGSVIYVIVNSDLDKGNVSLDSRESFDTYKPDDSGIVRPLEAAIPLDKRMDNFAKKRKGSQKWGEESEHKKGARPSTQRKHEKGQSRKGRDKGGEKGDDRRPYRRK